MIDASRHFLPLKTMKRQVDALAMSKSNVLHVHVIDSQSSAYAPTDAPAAEFAKACYENGETYKLVQTQLAELSVYANSLGIHLLLEFDMPGHAASWQKLSRDVVANCPTYGNSTVDPTANATYEYIEAFIKEIIATIYVPLGKEALIHLGGDEVDHGCWTEDANIAAYMKQNNLTTKTLWQ